MNTDRVIAALGALAQETRLAIFRLLVQAGPKGLSVGRIGDALGAAPATLSFHLRTLTQAGLVATRQEGRFIFCAADYDAMAALVAYLSENCCGGAAACAPPSQAGRATARGSRRANVGRRTTGASTARPIANRTRE